MSSTNHEEPSKLSALKDQAVGTVKHAIGNVLKNNKLEVEGQAQKVHGKNEYEHAKATKNKESEPEIPTQQGYDPQTYNQQSYQQSHPNQETVSQGVAPSAQAQTAHQAVPPAPPQPSSQAVPPAPPQPISHQGYDPQTYNQQSHQIHESHNPQVAQGTVPPAPPQPISHQEDKPQTSTHSIPQPPAQEASQMSGLKDQAVGSLKESFGSATGNPNAELEGKAQQLHGKNETEFAKAQNEGLDEPRHYAHGTKTTRHAEGEVEDQSVSTLGALKDKTVGSVKEMLGSMTGNQDLELKGKAQNVHGRNEAEFVKAEKEGLSEPQHFSHGTKTTDHAEGQVEGQEVSTLSAMKDQISGAAKETVGKATGNSNTELEGTAQKIHGRNEAEFAKAQKEGLMEPPHYAHGSLGSDAQSNTFNA